MSDGNVKILRKKKEEEEAFVLIFKHEDQQIFFRPYVMVSNIKRYTLVYEDKNQNLKWILVADYFNKSRFCDVACPKEMKMK